MSTALGIDSIEQSLFNRAIGDFQKSTGFSKRFERNQPDNCKS